MSKIFSGNSPQKTLARAFAYSKIARKDFYSKSHIVIASRECGDIKFLLENGVDKKNIVACDTDPVAMIAASKLGVALSPFADIERTAQLYSATRKLASVNVDLCMTLKRGIPVFDTVLGHTYGITPTFFTFCRYRDGMSSMKQRLTYFQTMTGISTDAGALLHYQSYTKNNNGSPMSVFVI